MPEAVGFRDGRFSPPVTPVAGHQTRPPRPRFRHHTAPPRRVTKPARHTHVTPTGVGGCDETGRSL